MKRFLLAVLFVCCISLVYAQKATQDVVYLKNGSVIKGAILPSTEGTIKIQTRDGSVFVYNLSDVESKKEEQVTHTITGRKILDLPKQSFGVKAGVAYTSVLLPDTWSQLSISSLSGIAVNAGVSYEHTLGQANRWFFQTGLDMLYINTFLTSFSIGDKVYYPEDYKECLEVTSNTLFFEIPMMISYKVKLNNEMVVAPSLGFTHRIGIWGEFTGLTPVERYDDYWGSMHSYDKFSHSAFKKNYDEFGESPVFVHRYDRYMFNLKAGVDLNINKHVVLGLNIYLPIVGDRYSTIFTGEGAFRIGVTAGYNF